MNFVFIRIRPQGSFIKAPFADQLKVGEDQIFVGVGSDDASLCFLTFLIRKNWILFPDITYSFYPVWANLYRIPYVCPKLDGKFRIVKEDYYKVNGESFSESKCPDGDL